MTKKNLLKIKKPKDNKNEPNKEVNNDANTKKICLSIKENKYPQGLYNLGNTCYFNSMLQMLLHSPYFLQELRWYCSSDRNIVTQVENKEYSLTLKISDVSSIEKELLLLWQSDKGNVSNLRDSLLENVDFEAHFGGFNQQDSHEVFLMVLNIIKDAQIKRAKKSVLNYFDARKTVMAKSINTEQTKKKTEEILKRVERQTLVNSLFGIIIGSVLKCKNCGELRMRFDEVLDIAPVFPSNFENEQMEEATKNNGKAKKDSEEIVIIKSKTNAPVTLKESKHQLKKQKRIEKKVSRNKRSVLRSGHSNETEAEEVDKDVDGEREDIVEESEEVMDNPIVFGGDNGSDFMTDLVTAQLIYDTSVKRSRSRNSSAAMSDDFVYVTDDQFAHLSLGDQDFQRHPTDDRGDSEEMNDVPKRTNTDTTQRSKNGAYLATLKSHQEHLNGLGQDKIVYDKQTDLDRALSRFCTPTLLDKVVCDRCSKTNEKVQTNHYKTDIICHLPQILPLYVSRFKQTATKHRTKNTQAYTYPFVLNLSSQCSQYANVGSGTAPLLYRLFGIIEHIGSSINSGHYVSYVGRLKSQTERKGAVGGPYPVDMLAEVTRRHGQKMHERDHLQPATDTPSVDDPSLYEWFRISDSQVEPIATHRVVHVQAFMLFYARV